MPARRLRVKNVGEYLFVHASPALQIWSYGTSGQFVAVPAVISPVVQVTPAAHRSSTVTTTRIGAPVVLGGGGGGEVAAVVVGLLAVEVRHRGAVRIHHIVQVRPPRLVAVRRGVRVGVARLAG